MESRRQKKIAELIKEEMGAFLQKEGANYYGNKFVTVTNVSITPDLQECKIFISVWHETEPQKVADSLNRHAGDIRRRFGNIMRQSLRIIPHISFHIDDSLDTVFKLEQIFKDINDKNNS
ncbi:MAG: 30S ribosome-binding factor RbfA [Fimbriimonadaceae bacterium]|nr:30S ribosome-binding factor RbfA [Chitinophagales bacterium]